MIQHIDRPDDPRIAGYARVGDHRWLRSQGLFVAEGRLVLQRLLDLQRFAIASIAVTPSAAAALAGAIDAVPAPVFVCAPDILRAVTGFDFHRGCLALVKRPTPELPLGCFADARRLLALEGIGNPDNLGGIFRVAAAFSVDGIILDGTCADPFYRKAIRTSMGAVLRVPFTAVADFRHSLETMRAAGLRVVGFTPSGGEITIQRFAAGLPPGTRLLLMFGAEGPGLRADALLAADDLVRIPMSGAVDSLNVTVAAGIALAFLDRSHAA